MSLIPTTLLVMRRLQALLQTIDTVNGVAVDMTSRVLRGRIIIGADERPEPHLLSLVEAPAPEVGTFFAGDWNEQRRDTVPILLQGLSLDDRTYSTDDAYYLAAAAQVALAKINTEDATSGEPVYPEHFMLGGLLHSIDIGRPVVRPPESGVSQYAFFFLPVRVGISGLVGQPFTEV